VALEAIRRKAARLVMEEARASAAVAVAES
jgi:hypothetical protein